MTEPRAPFLVTTTLIGPDTLDLLEPGLASVVGLVDACVLIPTDPSVTDSDVRHCARRAGLRGSQFRICRFDWCNDFSAARNFALDQAHAAGASWSLMLDTDERYAGDGKVLRELLAPSALGAYYVPHASGSYSQARLVKLPCPIRYSGRTHEAFPAYQVPTLALAPSVLAFSDVPKTAEQMQTKLLRDLRILEEETTAHPDQSRWWFYLGETRCNLGDPSGAVLAYDKCVALRGWNEEAAWACYRAAECLCKLDQFVTAIDRCATGLARHPGVGELAWLAGFASFRLGRFEDAVCWAAMASATSVYLGVGRAVHRIGFQNPPARYELPWDLMRWAWQAIGRPDLARAAELKCSDARTCRSSGNDPAATPLYTDPPAVTTVEQPPLDERAS